METTNKPTKKIFNINGSIEDDNEKNYFIKINNGDLIGPFIDVFDLFDNLRYLCLREKDFNFEIYELE